ncbi:DC-STAMP domain-containing protein 2 [Rana temporaria]|uniref:DC-STAMP domain-containing protein 2 n=1 Tax=Rana temporaria TaxID=8407 RepID=UPI001AAD3B87|nr:DC-STAMP domain-containing protein 2 [Rana temporaria]
MVCAYINPCILVRACFRACLKSFRCDEILDRDILPDWCPRAADLKSPTEVTGLDHFDDDDNRRAGGQKERRWWAEFLKSILFLLLGMVLTSIYFYLVLIRMSYNFNFCIISTLFIGLFLCMGIPFFTRIRVTVFLMGPHFFSALLGYARVITLIIILSLAMNGPAANITENFQRVINSSACGVQVVMNQTLEIVERVKEPLMRVLNFLQEMAGKVKNVAGKAKNFFQRIKAQMKVIGLTLISFFLVGKTLGHMWSFIHSIGNICNEELLNPYKKCAKIFTDAKEDCYDRGAGFLCEFVDTVSWVCHVAKIIQIICIIPTYVGEYIQKNFKAPIMSVLQDLKNKFDYNMTINYELGGTVNSSKSIFTIARDIMEEVKADLDPYREIFQLFSYSVFIIAIFTYFKALSYLRSYASDDNYDNIYITREFIRMDARRIKQGLTSLLPLSETESYGLVRPMDFKLTRKERKGYTFEIFNVFQSQLLVSFIIAADYFVYWCIAAISSVLNGDLVVKVFLLSSPAPYTLRLNITGSGFINSILAKLADALDAIGQKNYTVISKDCIPVPSEPNYYVYLMIENISMTNPLCSLFYSLFTAGLYIFAFFSSAMGVYIHRLKRCVCAWYFPQREQERLCFLFNNLLTKRMNLETSLKKSIRMNSADGHSNVLMVLAAQIPGFSFLTKLFGTTERYCMSCAKMTTPATSDQFVECMTTSCKGLYCKNCFEILHNICLICMGPLAYKEDIDEELRDEQLELWIEAMKQLKGKRAEKRKMKGALKKRLRHIVRRRGLETEIVQKYVAARQQDSDGESSGFSEHRSSSESEVTDYEYQDRSESSDSEREDWPAPEEYREPPDLFHRGSLGPG